MMMMMMMMVWIVGRVGSSLYVSNLGYHNCYRNHHDIDHINYNLHDTSYDD